MLSDLDHAIDLEWLETDGTGSFAMGTVAGLATRRYHGLLAAALRPPVARHLLLARVEDVAVVDGRTFELGAARHLHEFQTDPWPTWTYELAGARLTRQVFLVHGRRTVVVRWRCDRPCRLSARPFTAFRPIHAVTHQNPEHDPSVAAAPGRLLLRPYASLPALALHHDAARFRAAPLWVGGHVLSEEVARGYDETEDLWTPGVLEWELAAGADATFVATLDPELHLDGPELETAERARRAALVSPASRSDRSRALLERAADAFVVRRADGRTTIIAGYPWFTDWGRDTMIALPGLLVARGRVTEAEDVLAGWLEHLDRGVVPNRFPDEDDAAEHGTVDATLWAFVAMRAVLDAGGGAALLGDVFWPKALEIVDWHRRGTRHGIAVDASDGLLAAGEHGLALTWMDARPDGRPVTPRMGKPVEIQALWHHALASLAEWGARLGRPEEARAFSEQAARVAASFGRAFWSDARGHLADVIGPDGQADTRLRPNQLLAVSLPHALLDAERQRAVVRAVERHLVTPVGLRTLAPFEPGYVGRYAGGPAQRDAAYHQGAVWPWLLGPFVSARLRAFGRTRENLAHCRALLGPLLRHIEDEGCIGQVSEIFEGDPPHRPAGAPAQAWSVAELLRLLAVELASGANAR